MMFTLEQIKAAHAKVKSGADFPAYIRDLKKLGVNSYETFVEDGRSNYHGKGGFEIASEAKYDSIPISAQVRQEQFKTDLADHQKGHSDYLQFITACARSGVQKWVVCLDPMTCTYFDGAGSKILVEQIPNK